MEFDAPPDSVFEADLASITWPTRFKLLDRHIVAAIVNWADAAQRVIGAGPCGDGILLLTGAGAVMVYEIKLDLSFVPSEMGAEVAVQQNNGDIHSTMPASWLIQRARRLNLVVRFDAWQPR